MSRPIERRRETGHQGLPLQEHGLSTEFYKRQLAEAEATKAQRKKEQHDRPQSSDKQTPKDLSSNLNIQSNDNKTQAHLVAQKTGEPIAVEMPTPAQQKMADLFNLTAKGQALQQQQTELAQQQQTTIRAASDTKGVLQERGTNQGGERERKASADITNTNKKDGDITTKRAKFDKPQDGNIASLKTEMEREALASKMGLSDSDKENIREQVKAKFKQDQQKEQSQTAQQEAAERLWRQGVPDATQQPDKKHSDSDSNSNSDSSQTQRQQLEAKRREDAQQDELPLQTIQKDHLASGY